MSKALGLIIIILVLGGGYFLLKSKTMAPATVPVAVPTSVPTLVPTSPLPPPESSSSEMREITVVGSEFNFNPSSLNLKAGEKVKLTFKNEGNIAHNFVIKSENLNVDTEIIGPGETKVIDLTAPSAGTYTFFCSVGNHRASGMEGTLKVAEDTSSTESSPNLQKPKNIGF